MAKDRYFDLRQSTRAYQNPYEAGGIGVGGLTESARYNRQQVGSSFLSAPSGTSSWTGKSGRTASRGGMVSMPTDGPTPLGGAPDRPQKMGPAGPSALAAGVAGRFERPSESTWAPTGESGKSLVTALSIPVGGALAARRERKERKKAKDLAAMNADYDLGLTLDLKAGISDMEDVKLGTKKAKPMLALPAASTPFDPQAQQVSMKHSMGRAGVGPPPLREPTGGPIPAGPVPQPLALPAGPAGKPQSSYTVSGTDEPAARVSQVGGTYTDVNMRPSAEAEATQQAARLMEYPAAKAKSRTKNRGKKK